MVVIAGLPKAEAEFLFIRVCRSCGMAVVAANCKKVDALTAIGEWVQADSLALEIHGRTVTRGGLLV